MKHSSGWLRAFQVQRIACDTPPWRSRGVVHAPFDPIALGRAQCAAGPEGEAMDAGHLIAEELPAPTAARLLGFLSKP